MKITRLDLRPSRGNRERISVIRRNPRRHRQVGRWMQRWIRDSCARHGGGPRSPRAAGCDGGRARSGTTRGGNEVPCFPVEEQRGPARMAAGQSHGTRAKAALAPMPLNTDPGGDPKCPSSLCHLLPMGRSTYVPCPRLAFLQQGHYRGYMTAGAVRILTCPAPGGSRTGSSFGRARKNADAADPQSRPCTPMPLRPCCGPCRPCILACGARAPSRSSIMSRRFGWFGIATLAAVLLLPRPGRAQQEFAWQGDFDAARAQARAEGRPLLVVFR